MAYFEFPHTRTYDSDLGWLIRAYNRVEEKLDQYLETSSITFADPITWNITKQYTALTCVVDSDGTAYLSKQPVPAGIAITNTDYWLPIFNYDDNINELRSQIAYNAGDNPTAGVNIEEGSLVFWKGLLYIAIADIPAGSAFIVGANIRAYTVDERIRELAAEVAAVPTVYILPEDFGAVGDGVTDDTAALTACFAVGAPVYMTGTYKISATIPYSGKELFGGKIICENFASDQRRAIDITGTDIYVHDLEIDCNNACAVGLNIDVLRNARVTGCYIHNTHNSYIGANYSSTAIHIYNCTSAEVLDNVIDQINRSSGTANVHSSCGIAVFASDTIRVAGNKISNILSSISYFDCDGVYVGTHTATPVSAIVENNTILNATGRFIKSQTAYTIVRNNYCDFTISFTPSDRYFNCVSVQRGSAEIVNNYFNLRGNVHRSYTRCFSFEVYDSVPRTAVISGNTVISLGVAAPAYIRNYVYVVSQSAETHSIAFDIFSNIFDGAAEGAFGYGAGYSIKGVVDIHNNIMKAYQVIDSTNSTYKPLDDLFIRCVNNENRYTGATRLSALDLPFSALEFTDNIGFNENINNNPLSYTSLKRFRGFYRGASAPMTDLPAAITSGVNIYLDKNSKVCQYILPDGTVGAVMV